jgi:HAD superfamily hydrolase (TIGR01549 family)
LTETVIFDLDGTLVKIPIDYPKFAYELQKILGKKNIHPLLKTISNSTDKEQQAIFNVWDELELSAVPRVTLIAEGRRIYDKFCGKQKALVTMQGKKLVSAVLEHFQLDFDVVVTREDSLNRTEQLRMVGEKLKLKMENVFFVGNKEYDYKAAKQIGCQFMKVKN